MAQSHREAARRLFEFAEQQQGFFTTKQAKLAGFAENMLDGIYGDINDKLRKPLKTIMDQTFRLSAMVTDLLNISRIEQGRITFDMKPVNIAEIIQPMFVRRHYCFCLCLAPAKNS